MKKSLILFIILAITFICYIPSLQNGFTNWDDESHLLENLTVRSLDFQNIIQIFKETVNLTYIPLTTLSFAIEHALFEYNPFIYHLNNLILHLIVTWLIFVFAMRMGLNGIAAGLAALLFGIHPMHVESVAWVTERKDVLYAVFYMLALNSYWRYVEEGNKRAYILSIVYGLLSILAKPMALSLPLILLVCDKLKGRKIGANLFVEKIPHFLVAISIAWITFSLNARGNIEANALEAALTWVWTFTFYVQKFFIPNDFLPLYDLPKPIVLQSLAYFSSIIVFIFIIGLVVRFYRNALFLFAWMFYFFSIFFLLRFDHKVDFTIVADRFMYLPSLGFCLLLGMLFEKGLGQLRSKRKILGQLVLVIIVFVYGMCAVKTFQQCKIWKDSLTLWSTAIEHNPNNPHLALAYYNRGKAYEYQGDDVLAFNDYNKALELKPDYADAYNNRGTIFDRQGQYELAIKDYAYAIKLAPQLPKAYNNRGIVYSRLNEVELALVDFKKAIELNPNFTRAYNNRGLTYLQKGMLQMALADFDQAIGLSPTYADAYYNRGNLYKKSGSFQDAIDNYTFAVKHSSTHLKAYINRGNIYGALKKYRLAIEDYTRVINERPDDFEIYINRGVAYQLSGQGDLALKDFNQALAVNADAVAAYANRGNLFTKREEYDLAIRDYTQALSIDKNQSIIYYTRSMAYASKGLYTLALEDARTAKNLGHPNLEVYIAKIIKLMDRKEKAF